MVVTAGTLSAFLVNDAVCLVMAPLVIEVTRALRRNPVPYLLALAMAANVGSTATITGNPQNMIIGAISHIPYTAFAAVLAPVAIAGLVLVMAVILAAWRSEFCDPERLSAAAARTVRRPQMIKAVLVTGGVVVLFFAGVPVAKAAILGGALLLVPAPSRRARSTARSTAPADDVRRLVRGGGGRREGAAEPRCGRGRARPAPRRRLGLDRVTAVLSNIISNVPAVLALKPFVAGLPDEPRAWLVIAMSSTLAGNFTLVGSVANLIVAERARRAGIEISFLAYCRAGIPLTLLTLALGAWWLS